MFLIAGLLSKDLFDLLIVDSSFSERLWIKAGFCQSKIFKIPFGININSTPLPNVLERKNLISTRSWEKNYNQETILSAIKLINNEAYYQPVHFMGTGSMLAPLRSKFMELDDNDKVVYFGNIDNLKLQKILTRYKLYISASSSDGTSVSMLEAMAAGTPVLVADIEPNREWITHGENGFLFETFSPDDLAFKLTEILQDKFDLAAIAGSAMQAVRSRADWFRNSQALVSALRSI